MTAQPSRNGRKTSARPLARVGALVGAGLAIAFSAIPAIAHHSFSVFDMATQKELEGDVVEFQWTNPHTFLWIDVKGADGKATKWGLEGMSPNFLGRRGWTKHTFNPGDHVKVVIAPLKSGEPGGTLMRATLQDGTEMVNFGRAPGG
jgi:hypothetical protein